MEDESSSDEDDLAPSLDASDGEEPSSDDELPEADPGDEFFSMLSDLYFQGLSANKFCILCHWAVKGGLRGPAERAAMAPGKDTGAYQKRLDKVLGFTDAISELYEFTVPGHSKYDLTRTLHTLPSVTAFEALCNELAETPEFRFNFDPAELPPVYHEHRVVRDGAAAGVDVVPTALYVDGVPYTKTDGVIGWWLVNIASGRRHLLVVVRKRNTCKCGCRGWCTYFAVFDFLRWALAAMAEGSWPTSRHDGADWKDSDANRSVFAGSPLGYRAAVIHIKCDWMEACATFGFPTWTHSLRPCLKCASPPSELHNIAGVSLDDFPFHVNTHDDYLSACGRCEVVAQGIP